MSTDTSDVASKLMAWVLGGTGALIVYSAYRSQNPLNVLKGVVGPSIYQPGSGVPDLPPDPKAPPPGNVSDPVRIRQIANREIAPTLVDIPGGGKLDIASAASLRRINAKLGYTVGNVGAWRSYAEQLRLWLDKPGTFGDPNKSLHVVGLAIDVVDSQRENQALQQAFAAEGWHRARALGIGGCGTQGRDDEHWHWSYGVCG
jgi:hypothetical protein